MNSQIQSYYASIVGGLFALVAILVAIEQFKTDKTPHIIPRNKVFFFYSNFGGHIALLDSPEQEFDINIIIENTPIMLQLENVTQNSALEFQMEINYKNGDYYRSICKLIGGEPTEVLHSTWENNLYPNQGVFNANSNKTFELTTNLEFTVKGIFYRLFEPDIDISARASRGNHFVRKEYKIGELLINVVDIAGNKINSKFDIYIKISPLIASKAQYEVRLYFKRDKS